MNTPNVTFKPSFIHALVADMIGDMLGDNLGSDHFRVMHKIMLTSTQPVVDTSNFRDLMMSQGWELVIRDSALSPRLHAAAWSYADAMLTHLLQQTADPAQQPLQFPPITEKLSPTVEGSAWAEASAAEASPPAPPASKWNTEVWPLQTEVKQDDTTPCSTEPASPVIAHEDRPDVGMDLTKWPFPEGAVNVAPAPVANVAEPVNGFDAGTAAILRNAGFDPATFK